MNKEMVWILYEMEWRMEALRADPTCHWGDAESRIDALQEIVNLIHKECPAGSRAHIDAFRDDDGVLPVKAISVH